MVNLSNCLANVKDRGWQVYDVLVGGRGSAVMYRRISLTLFIAVALSVHSTARSEDFIDLDNLIEIDDSISISPSVADPFEGLNRAVFGFNDYVYKNVLSPFTRQYTRVVPREARKGIGNFFANLKYPVRLTGNLLQFKFGNVAKETGKFVINSTIGLGGFRNAAKYEDALDGPEEDIGQAFGAWGAKHGFYVVLPLLGPSSLRDFVGRVGGNAVDPLSEPWPRVGDVQDRLILQTTDTINDLPEILELYKSITDSAIDPYTAMRDGYAQFRAFQVEE